MLRKYSAGLLLLVCTLAAADHWIAIRAGHLFDGTVKPADLERVQFVMKGVHIFKNELK
jgi:hypothetical protein